MYVLVVELNESAVSATSVSLAWGTVRGLLAALASSALPCPECAGQSGAQTQ